MTLKVYHAQRIITMNPAHPEGRYLAVRDGRVLAVADRLEHIAPWGEVECDERYADCVMMPGFVEGHSHAQEGAVWDYLYLGYHDRYDPDGQLWPGLTTRDAIVARLREALERLPADKPLIAWGFDPVFFTGERIDRRLLDAADRERPIVVLHASLHVMTVNSAMLERANVDAHRVEGIVRDDSDHANGELREMAAMHLVFNALDFDIFDDTATVRALSRYAMTARRVGVTTMTDLLNPMHPRALEALEAATRQDAFPVRLVPAMNVLGWDIDAGIARINEIRAHSHARLHLGLVKLMTDGAIQNFTARLKWPGYLTTTDNGQWNAPPEHLANVVSAYHQAGCQLHIHTNGDEASELIIDALEQALELWPRADHRHTLQHCQLIDQAQLKRAAKLGLCLNIFANHIYYWGDTHLARTLGHERCQRLEPFASAARLRIPFAMHCDAPVTPLAPLFTAWCAVNRLTSAGVRLGEHECLNVDQALHAITLGAAYTLKLDHLVGSLESGKFADVAVLEDDPYQVDSSHLKDIRVRATLLGGEPTDAFHHSER